ncbi:MAG: hypothetical protein ACON4O_09955 [Lentimonas sp.]
MADKSDDTPKQALDLNSLSGLDFGPNWADGKQQKSSSKQYENYKGDSRGKGKRHNGGAGNRDRRAGGRPERRGGGGSEGRPPRRDDRRGGDNRGGDDRGGDRRRHAPIFNPTVKIDLYPQDEAFDALVKRLRATVRTYQLFEIAHLLLEKPERYVVVVSNKAKAGEKPAPLFYSVPGHLPFETEEAAVSHVIANHLDQFFDIEEIEVEPPKGNFQMVNKCGVTGELLGPPNYHRYQEFLQTHYASRINGMSFERFQSKIETVKEQEDIDTWMESMKKGARYTLKERKDGEPESFETLESVRHFLLQHRKDKVVGSGEHIRFAGRDIVHLPKGDIRRSVETYVSQQLHFPLEAANNIRGRLRRHKFTVYKKGSKGVSFVCAVKRKFRDSQTVFTDSIRDLIEFIEKNPNIPASKLPKQYIDIDTEKQRPEELKVTEAEVAAAAEAKGETEGDGESAAPVEATVAPDAAASTEATPKMDLTADEQTKLKQLMLDLRWLITEGYVTEYGDGKLFAAPPMPEPKKPVGEAAKEVAPEPTPEASPEPEPVSEALAAEAKVETAPEPEGAPAPEAEKAPEPTPEPIEVVAPAAEREVKEEAPKPAKKAANKAAKKKVVKKVEDVDPFDFESIADISSEKE